MPSFIVLAQRNIVFWRGWNAPPLTIESQKKPVLNRVKTVQNSDFKKIYIYLNTPTQEERLADVIACLKSDQLLSNHRIARLL